MAWEDKHMETPRILVIDDEKESKHSRSFVRLFGRRRPGRGESAVCPACPPRSPFGRD